MLLVVGKEHLSSSDYAATKVMVRFSATENIMVASVRMDKKVRDALLLPIK